MAVPPPDDPTPPPRALRHPDRTKPFAPPAGISHYDEITAHVERHFGPIAKVLHEIVSDLVHLDVLVVAATPERPFVTLVTSGMSDLPMRVPDGSDAAPFAELLIQAPASFDLDRLADERVYWPIRHLKTLARMPHELDTWFAAGQTVSTDPPTPVAEGVDFCAFGFVPPLETAASRLRCKDGIEIAFLQAVPMYREELDWKLQQNDQNALAKLFDTQFLRLAMAGRPPLRGDAWDRRVDGAQERLARGRRIVRGVAWGIALTVIAATAATLVYETPRWGSLLLGLTVAWSLGAGERWARWVALLMLTIGVAVGASWLTQNGLHDLRAITLAVALPLWAIAAFALVLPPSVRVYYKSRR